MGEALISGLLESGMDRALLTAVEPDAGRLDHIKTTYRISGKLSLRELSFQTDIYLLAVKPQIIPAVLSQVKEAAQGDTPLIISIAAGISLKTLKTGLNSKRIIRAMPNTPALVRAGITAVCRDGSSEEDLALAEALFESVGQVLLIEERLIDAVTGLSGSGPAYVMLMLEGLTAGGVLEGLSQEAAYSLALNTVLGAARLARERGKHPAVLKDQVTSPGGTTIAGIMALEKGGFRKTVMEAVSAAAKRSKELSFDKKLN